MLTIDIEKRIGDFDLRVQMDVPPGVTALFGRSGSGKTLTLQCVAGLVQPDAGRISLNGRDLFRTGRAGPAGRINLPPQQRGVGYVFQQYALFPHLTVARNVAYGLHRLPAAEQAERVRTALRAVRLSGLEDRLPRQLSGGQAQRVALARALATRPQVLLLDEPFASLDSLVRAELHQELLALLHELAVPAILVTHDLREAYALSRHLAIIDEGQILQCDTREQAYYRPASRAAAELVGMTNFLPGTVQGEWVEGPGFRLPAPPGLAAGTRVECGVRPEHIMMLRPEAEAEGRGPGAVFGGRIAEEVDYGSHVLLWLELAGAGVAGAAGAAGVAGAAGGGLDRLAILLPNYIYERLRVAEQKDWHVMIKPQHVQVLPIQPRATNSATA